MPQTEIKTSLLYQPILYDVFIKLLDKKDKASCRLHRRERNAPSSVEILYAYVSYVRHSLFTFVGLGSKAGERDPGLVSWLKK
jgi:hypothetical protein